MAGLQIQDLRFAYPGSRFGLKVDQLALPPGERMALAGPSGAGKTTLLRLMTGLLAPHKGTVQLGDVDLTQLSEQARRRFRLAHVGLVFQDFALLDYLTVEENILLPMQFAGGALETGTDSPNAASDPGAAAYAQQLAERLEIAGYWRRLTARLSQGERQRVAIARALAHRPAFVFADEPTASLDDARRRVVMELLTEYAQQNQACLVMVTHDLDLMRLFPNTLRVDHLPK